MLDHVDVMYRLAEERARQAMLAGRRRPAPLVLTPAITEGGPCVPRHTGSLLTTTRGSWLPGLHRLRLRSPRQVQVSGLTSLSKVPHVPTD
jgi:hypothetical protein